MTTPAGEIKEDEGDVSALVLEQPKEFERRLPYYNILHAKH